MRYRSFKMQKCSNVIIALAGCPSVWILHSHISIGCCKRIPVSKLIILVKCIRALRVRWVADVKDVLVLRCIYTILLHPLRRGMCVFGSLNKQLNRLQLTFAGCKIKNSPIKQRLVQFHFFVFFSCKCSRAYKCWGASSSSTWSSSSWAPVETEVH